MPNRRAIYKRKNSLSYERRLLIFPALMALLLFFFACLLDNAQLAWNSSWAQWSLYNVQSFGRQVWPLAVVSTATLCTFIAKHTFTLYPSLPTTATYSLPQGDLCRGIRLYIQWRIYNIDGNKLWTSTQTRKQSCKNSRYRKMPE